MTPWAPLPCQQEQTSCQTYSSAGKATGGAGSGVCWAQSQQTLTDGPATSYVTLTMWFKLLKPWASFATLNRYVVPPHVIVLTTREEHKTTCC